jgi:hypothetical protein
MDKSWLWVSASRMLTLISQIHSWNETYMFMTVPLSIIRSFSLYTRQWYMSYRFADCLRAGSGWNGVPSWSCLQAVSKPVWHIPIAACTVENSWWRTEELHETCRVLFQKWIWEINISSWFYNKKFITMHGHVNVKRFMQIFIVNGILSLMGCHFASLAIWFSRFLYLQASRYTKKHHS